MSGWILIDFSGGNHGNTMAEYRQFIVYQSN